MSQSEIRIVLALVGGIVLFLVYWYGRPRKTPAVRADPQMPWGRRDPELPLGSPLSEQFGPADGYEDPDAEAPSDFRASESATPQAVQRDVDTPEAGTRATLDFDMIVSLHVMAKDGGELSGPELTVAAEKTSLVYGAQGLFHRMQDSAGAIEPVFSMVNRVMPGSFELSDMLELRTPGVSFFMTLPNPLPALEAWDKLLPAAQRLAGLLNADICDDEMNLLGRQRMAAIREDMRNYDRKTGRLAR
jgi:cell division protein ZipA